MAARRAGPDNGGAAAEEEDEEEEKGAAPMSTAEIGEPREDAARELRTEECTTGTYGAEEEEEKGAVPMAAAEALEPLEDAARIEECTKGTYGAEEEEEEKGTEDANEGYTGSSASSTIRSKCKASNRLYTGKASTPG